MRVCLHCSVGADQWMWAVCAAGCLQTAHPLFEGSSLTAHPACLLLSFCVCPLIKRLRLPVTLPDCVFTVKFESIWDETQTNQKFSFFLFFLSLRFTVTLTLKSCVNMQSGFPSDWMHPFPIPTVDRMVSERICCRLLPGETEASPQMDWCEKSCQVTVNRRPCLWWSSGQLCRS